jgi:hypothetical protein
MPGVADVVVVLLGVGSITTTGVSGKETLLLERERCIDCPRLLDLGLIYLVSRSSGHSSRRRRKDTTFEIRLSGKMSLGGCCVTLSAQLLPLPP